ncbi:MAG: NYN domain-containing protein [Candidatus Binatia bacterium]
MRVNVYIDGFNFFYGAVKGTPYKWLDFGKMCRLVLPNHQINKIKYFTAEVHARPHDPQQPARQQTYFRALRTTTNLEIILGHFLISKVSMLIAGSPANAPQYARVVKTEEKGSDVNLATHLLMDGFKSDYEMAVLVTNDSDLLEPIKVVRYALNLPVGLLNPHKRPSHALLPHATFIKQIRKGVLAASQFPATMTDKQGNFHKPASW